MLTDIFHDGQNIVSKSQEALCPNDIRIRVTVPAAALRQCGVVPTSVHRTTFSVFSKFVLTLARRLRPVLAHVKIERNSLQRRKFGFEFEQGFGAKMKFGGSLQQARSSVRSAVANSR